MHDITRVYEIVRDAATKLYIPDRDVSYIGTGKRVLIIPDRKQFTVLLAAPEELLLEPEQTRKKLALLLPGHNEELIIATTIRSAVAAGQPLEDIYVVDDASTDATYTLAVELLGKKHVLRVKRSGKALAVQKAIKKFNLVANYEWLHVADADSVFSPNYFTVYRKKLDSSKYAVAVGFVQSMRGNWISTYRALSYTYSQQISRRIQAKFGMISVFPGPITSFRTDILPKLDFKSNTLTEDFDVTLQVHRKKLGRIVFIPGAINYTQDPQTLKDFCAQTMRWQRGFFQGVKKYRVGLKGQRIDVSLGLQMLQSLFFLVQILVLFPFIIATTGSWLIIPVAIAADMVMTGVIAIGSSFAARRWNLLGALPYFYFLRWLETGIYFMAFFEVMVLKRFQAEVRGWGTEGRRYKLSSAALADVKARS
jgi:cellulose synthase/poly-beta-1,6-N-acetylglucosamine synthase-like glycosyltransferase